MTHISDQRLLVSNQRFLAEVVEVKISALAEIVLLREAARKPVDLILPPNTDKTLYRSHKHKNPDRKPTMKRKHRLRNRHV